MALVPMYKEDLEISAEDWQVEDMSAAGWSTEKVEKPAKEADKHAASGKRVLPAKQE